MHIAHKRPAHIAIGSVFRTFFFGAVALSFGLASATPLTADDYSFHVSYHAYLNGLPVGEGFLNGRFSGGDYRLLAQGEFAGIARVLGNYSGQSTSRGNLSTGPSSFRVKASGDGEEHDIRVTYVGREATEISIRPEPDAKRLDHPKRVKLTQAHKRGVIDPLSALVIPGAFDGKGFDRAACDRILPIFTGGERIDIRLAYRGIQTVSSNRSRRYSGPVLVCSLEYRPVAGHRSNNSSVRYMQGKASVEIMLAPVPDSDILVPYRASVTTPLGLAVIQAGNTSTDGRFRSRLADSGGN
jgi:hypothetical protein